MLVTINRFVVVLFCCLNFTFFSSSLVAQDVTGIDEHLQAGEFSVALEKAGSQSDTQLRDQMLQKIARSQRQSDTGLNAFSTAAMIQGDRSRFGTLTELLNYGNAGTTGNDNAGFGNRNGGQQGGITEQDFNELMDLIQETIDPDSWEANGGNGRMRPFPSGVFVDSQGTLKKIQRDTTGRLDEVRDVTTNDLEDGSLLQSSGMRKISLARLERELQYRAATAQTVSADLKHLAGIYRLQYVILYPETKDIVIAGPAGPWHYDETGRAINTESGHPVLNLDDLVVCLRNARRNGGQFTCSIDPRDDNLAAAKQFIESSSLKGKAWRNQLQQTLGQMDVTVSGIDPTTHAARVIVEADYHMKLVGLGVEPGVSGLRNYFDRIHLDENGNLPPMDQLVRWWFTMDYDSVDTNADRTIFELNGQGVKLLSESEFWNQQGQRVHTGVSSAAAGGFAEEFTRRFPDLVNEHPVYGELKNLFDCAIAANVIHNEALTREIEWNVAFLDGNVQPGMLSYQLPGELVPTQVNSILGQKVLTFREGRTHRRHTLSGFGGGVVFDASKHASSDQIKVVSSRTMNDQRQQSRPQVTGPRDWTWD